MREVRCTQCGRGPLQRWLRVEIHTSMASYGGSNFCGRFCVVAAVNDSEAVAPIGSPQAGEAFGAVETG